MGRGRQGRGRGVAAPEGGQRFEDRSKPDDTTQEVVQFGCSWIVSTVKRWFQQSNISTCFYDWGCAKSAVARRKARRHAPLSNGFQKFQRQCVKREQAAEIAAAIGAAWGRLLMYLSSIMRRGSRWPLHGGQAGTASMWLSSAVVGPSLC